LDFVKNIREIRFLEKQKENHILEKNIWKNIDL